MPVTKPFLPPKEEYEALIYTILETSWMTNMDPLANELEEKIKKHD